MTRAWLAHQTDEKDGIPKPHVMTMANSVFGTVSRAKEFFESDFWKGPRTPIIVCRDRLNYFRESEWRWDLTYHELLEHYSRLSDEELLEIAGSGDDCKPRGS